MQQRVRCRRRSQRPFQRRRVVKGWRRARQTPLLRPVPRTSLQQRASCSARSARWQNARRLWRVRRPSWRAVAARSKTRIVAWPRSNSAQLTGSARCPRRCVGSFALPTPICMRARVASIRSPRCRRSRSPTRGPPKRSRGPRKGVERSARTGVVRVAWAAELLSSFESRSSKTCCKCAIGRFTRWSIRAVHALAPTLAPPQRSPPPRGSLGGSSSRRRARVNSRATITSPRSSLRAAARVRPSTRAPPPPVRRRLVSRLPLATPPPQASRATSRASPMGGWAGASRPLLRRRRPAARAADRVAVAAVAPPGRRPPRHAARARRCPHWRGQGAARVLARPSRALSTAARPHRRILGAR